MNYAPKPKYKLKVDPTCQEPYVDGEWLVVPPELEVMATEALRDPLFLPTLKRIKRAAGQ